MQNRLLSLMLALLSIFVSVFSVNAFANAEALPDGSADEDWYSYDIVSEEDGNLLAQVQFSGEYIIRNAGTNRYLDVENQNISSGSKLCQWRIKGRASQRWTITLESNGYYTISQTRIGRKYYMGVQGDQTGNDVQIVLRTGAVTDGMRWKITQTSKGHYKLTAKVSESFGRVLGVGANQPNSDGAYIKQRTYVNDSNYRDEWELVGKNGATLTASCGTSHSHGNDHISTFPSVKAVLTQLMFTPVGIEKNATKTCFIERLATSKIIFFRGHGAQKAIATSDKYQVSYGDIQTLSNGALSGVKLVLFGACDTGKGRASANNMVNIIHNKGAKTVIGFSNSVGCYETNYWSNEFFIGLRKTGNIREALAYAKTRTKKKFKKNRTTDNPYVAGNKGTLSSN